jgi:L-ascorbate metabolism protein UlaG (beta-lactamase superfamily)
MLGRALRRFARWTAFALGGLVALAAIGVVLMWLSSGHFVAFGGDPGVTEPELLRASPEFVAGRFRNSESTHLMAGRRWLGAMKHMLLGPEMRKPICALPVVPDTGARLRTHDESGLRITWLGHSTTLVEIDGAVVLTDPMWGERASPSSWVGPRRFHPPPLAIADLPHVDAVVISHEHYDHLDEGSVRALAARGIAFHVPLGIGAHLAAWGVPAAQITEHDWWQDAVLPGGVRVVATPARHFNGRGLPWRTGALWASWSIVGPRHRVFFSGDTGPTEAMREIGRRLGPFDVSLLEVGQYNVAWGDIHLGPLGALQAHEWLGAKTLIPIHWATFILAYHAWSEPAEAVYTEAVRRGVSLLTPRLGEPLEPAGAIPPVTTPWWRALPPLAASCP